ncbi:MAG: DUF2332 domain-containing protein [Gaiella sp.]
MAEAQADALRRQAGQFAALGAAVYADLARTLADDPARAARVLGDDTSWDIGLRLFGGVHYLVLTGVAPDALSGRFDDFAAALVDHERTLARWMVEQGVQTNEVRRCIGLLPAFLTIARETGLPLELLELGPSAGLNLQLDRYRYVYASGTWGDPAAAVVLEAIEERPVPAELLATPLAIGRRRGVDLSPIDATRDQGLQLLRSFLWPGDDERRARLEAAVATLRASVEPPELVRGDYVELLPALVADRPADAVTVVFQTASTAYLPPAGRARIAATLDAAAADGRPLAWVSTRSSDEREGHRDDAWELELRIWPGGMRHVAHLGYHGARLDWIGG